MAIHHSVMELVWKCPISFLKMEISVNLAAGTSEAIVEVFRCKCSMSMYVLYESVYEKDVSRYRK